MVFIRSSSLRICYSNMENITTAPAPASSIRRILSTSSERVQAETTIGDRSFIPRYVVLNFVIFYDLTIVLFFLFYLHKGIRVLFYRKKEPMLRLPFALPCPPAQQPAIRENNHSTSTSFSEVPFRGFRGKKMKKALALKTRALK